MSTRPRRTRRAFTVRAAVAGAPPQSIVAASPRAAARCFWQRADAELHRSQVVVAAERGVYRCRRDRSGRVYEVAAERVGGDDRA